MWRTPFDKGGQYYKISPNPSFSKRGSHRKGGRALGKLLFGMLISKQISDKMIPLDKVLNLFSPEPEAIITSQRRQTSVWRRDELDYLPLLLTGATLPQRENLPTYDLKEQFFDKEKMLYEQVWGVLSIVGDTLPSVRANFGTGFLASVLGLEQEVFADKMPWLKKHLSKDEIKKLTPETLNPVWEMGLVPRAKEYMIFFQERLNGKAAVYLPDTQGPFDLAHLIRGNEIFTDIYDDPGFVHHLMRLSTYCYVEVTKCLKKVIAEPLNAGYHAGCLYMDDCGVRSCEDTTTLLSPDSVREFIVPYIREALSPFGGGWLHFCGKGEHLLETFLEIPEVKGINFGNPENYTPAELLPKLERKGKVYYGGFPREEGEGMEEYFVRLLSPLRRKGTLILLFALPAGEGASSVLTLWHSVQDKIFG